MTTVSLESIYDSISEREQTTTRAIRNRYAEGIEDAPLYFNEPANYSIWRGHRTPQFRSK